MTDTPASNDETALVRNDEVDEHGVPVLLTEKQQMRYARMWLDNGVVSRNSFKNPLQVLAGIQAIKALGLQPMTALRQTGFVNGQFIVYGDIPLAVVRRSGKLEWMHEFVYVVDEKTGRYVERSFENSNLHLPVRGAVCVMKHIDEARPYIANYSAEDAMLPGLWKKMGPWTTYPHIMLMRKARNVCIQKGFSDVTHCVATEGDIENVPENIANQKLRERLEMMEAERGKARLIEAKQVAERSDNEGIKDYEDEMNSVVLPEAISPPDEFDYEEQAARHNAQQLPDDDEQAITRAP